MDSSYDKQNSEEIISVDTESIIQRKLYVGKNHNINNIYTSLGNKLFDNFTLSISDEELDKLDELIKNVQQMDSQAYLSSNEAYFIELISMCYQVRESILDFPLSNKGYLNSNDIFVTDQTIIISVFDALNLFESISPIAFSNAQTGVNFVFAVAPLMIKELAIGLTLRKIGINRILNEVTTQGQLIATSTAGSGQTLVSIGDSLIGTAKRDIAELKGNINMQAIDNFQSSLCNTSITAIIRRISYAWKGEQIK